MFVRRSTVIRSLLWSGASVVAVTGFIGLMHVPALRGLLARTGITWGCPIPKASPAQVEAAFAGATRKHLGTTPTTVKPAAGFALGDVTAQAARDRLATYGVACTAKDRGFHYLRCENVPAAALGETGAAIGLVPLAFDRSEKLLSVDVWRPGMSEADGLALFQARNETMQQQLGAPSHRQGIATVDALKNPLSMTSSEYAFSNYTAKVSATNIPGKGVAVREQFTDASRM